VTVKKHATAQVAINPKPLEPGMRRFLLVVGTFIPVATLAACTSPTEPSVETERCLASGKVPYASCSNKDVVNPWGDVVNPWGDDTTTTDTTRRGE
jgi:hypothetical protein